MLREINIQNYSVIKELSVAFKNGMNAITGETGAGKTVLINAIEMLLGARAETDKVLGKKAVITGVFETDYSIIEQLHSIDIDAENPLIIKRIIEKEGKSRAYINDSPVTISLLKRIGDSLVDIHGQYDHQFLLKKENQINLIDTIADNSALISQFKRLSDENDLIGNKIKDINDEIVQLAKEKDYFEFALKELTDIDLNNINEKETAERLFEIEHFEDIKENVQAMLYSIELNEDANIITLLSNVKNLIESTEINSDSFINAKSLLQTIIIEIDECVNELKRVDEKLIYDEGELIELRRTLADIDRLKNKYRMNVDELILYKEDIEKNLDTLNFPEEKLKKLRMRLKEVRNEMEICGSMIHNNRVNIAETFSTKINNNIKNLNMKGITLEIRVNFDAKKRKNGFDDVEIFVINKYKPEGVPLKEIVSGGELSRIMLAIKHVADKYDPIELMIFDEIDTGIGGNTAEKVAEFLMELSSRKQVIIITHLPQIAAKAATHFLVSKNKNIEISELNKDTRVEEIARMLGSSASEKTAIKHAQALLGK